MNATERARRSDSLYYDTQVTNRRALCDMIANLESDLAESKAENAKLRELVRDMWQFTGAACKKYPRLFDQSAQGGQIVMPNMLDSFEQRMHELGVDA